MIMDGMKPLIGKDLQIRLLAKVVAQELVIEAVLRIAKTLMEPAAREWFGSYLAAGAAVKAAPGYDLSEAERAEIGRLADRFLAEYGERFAAEPMAAAAAN